MGKVERFEDLIAWQKSRCLVRTVYCLTKGRSFRDDPSLLDQLRRAAVSAMSNIAEGFERHTRSEFAQYLRIAGASAGEVRSQMYVVEDCGYAPAPEAALVREQAEELSRVIAGLCNSVMQRMSQTGK